MVKFLKKYHKWLSIIFTIIILLFSISGIILNHRELVSGIDIDRKMLPKNYSYKNWNNAAVKGTLWISHDSLLVYGNIGIWLTNAEATDFIGFNNGFPEGIDNRKIADLILTNDKKLYAGTLFGLYVYQKGKWNYVDIPSDEKRITDLEIRNDSLLVLTRSHLFYTRDGELFNEIKIKEPEGYKNKIGLFRTLWVIHSGEIYGKTGKLIVDLFAIILIFLTVSGLWYFINRHFISRTKGKHRVQVSRTNRFLLKWHNKVGWIMFVFLILTAATGIFLRPPFLIAIANSNVTKIPYSKLDDDNPWSDRLRAIIFDKVANEYYISTSTGLYSIDHQFNTKPKRFPFQPPVSIMGINVFKKTGRTIFLIGSFEGLFMWNSFTGSTWDYIEQKPYIPTTGKTKPIGNYLVSGYSADLNGTEIFFDYNYGAMPLTKGNVPIMPQHIIDQPISLWNAALEVHTGRIFESLLSDFYILIVPLTGLVVIFLMISGFVVWYKLYKK